MLGRKIRALRLQLGLSQQQLAGKEMSRAFISLVEAGKCTPSRENLQLIAARLGRPVEYFLGTHSGDDLEAAIALLESVESDLNQGDEALEGAHRKLKHVSRLLEGVSRPDLKARAYLLWGQCLTRMGKEEEALAACEQAREYYRGLKDAPGQANAYRAEGTAAFRVQDYLRARHAYEQALLFSNGLKRMQAFRVEVLKYLGTTHLRLGNYQESMAQYEEAWKESEMLNDLAQRADIAMGLGAALHRTGEVLAALQWTQQAVTLYRQLGSPDYAMALHNLAVHETELGHWETAYAYLKEVLAAYEVQGHLDKQASALEDMARYWLQRGDLCRARSTCWSAIALLEQQDDAVLRGRLYRLLGTISAQDGRWEEARTMFHLSYEILRLLKADNEAKISREALDEARRQSPQMSEC